MRKVITIVSFILLCSQVSRSQYVTIHNSNLQSQLMGLYPTCFNTLGQMDTTCADIINEDSLYIYLLFSDTTPVNGLEYFKNLKTLDCDVSTALRQIDSLPSSLLSLRLDLDYFSLKLPTLPQGLKRFIMTGYGMLQQLPEWPSSLEVIDLDFVPYQTLPGFPANLRYLRLNNCSALEIPPFPSLLEHIFISEAVYVTSPLPVLPGTLKSLTVSGYFTGIPVLPAGLIRLNSSGCPRIGSLPVLPQGLKILLCKGDSLTQMPALPASLDSLDISVNVISNLQSFPPDLTYLKCGANLFSTLPSLPSTLKIFDCGFNQLTSLPDLPVTLTDIAVHNNQITQLPALPDSAKYITCANNLLTVLPGLPPALKNLDCSFNQLTELAQIPATLYYLNCYENDIYCLPVIPDFVPSDSTILLSDQHLLINYDPAKITCIPNYVPNLQMNFSTQLPPLCNPTNNINHCQSFPVMQGSIYYDNNNNNVKDAGEPVKKNIEVRLSNGNFTFSNINGLYQIGADGIGTYGITITPPQYFDVSPSSVNYNFSSYDTIVIKDIALHVNTVFDELTIRITPVNWAARPGFSFPYMISYENTGTTTLSANIVFEYDLTKLNYNTSSVTGVVDNADNLTYNTGSLQPGQSGSFISYFTLKTTVPLGDELHATAIISANTFTAYDSVQTTVRGAFDPNDKQATPQLSPSQVANGEYINYTIRFQNTGTDTAFTVVISDTLSDDLEANTLQMIASSHNCKTTVKDNNVFFEFLHILLPDSNINEPLSHGFVSFKIKPQTTVAVSTTIPNSAAIYFDYNTPVITNTAGTLIKDFTVVPLRLISFSAVPQNDNTTALYWNTANEINTKHFVIEMSNDGLRFTGITNVVAKGKANNHYNTAVAASNSGIIFYRFKIVDNNGSFTYSPIIKTDRRGTAAGFSILSNPVKDQLIINITNRALNNSTASIINMQGAVTKTFIIKEGSQALNIDGLPAGVYYLRTLNGSSKILIQ